MTVPRTAAGREIHSLLHRLSSQMKTCEMVPCPFAGLARRAEIEGASDVVEGAKAMFRDEAMICVACGLVMSPEDDDMLTAHEADKENSGECLSLPLRSVLQVFRDRETAEPTPIGMGLDA